MTTPDDLTGRLTLAPCLSQRHGSSTLWTGHLVDQPDRVVAVKSPRLVGSSDSGMLRRSQKHILNDIAALNMVNHPNVQKLYGTVILHGELSLVTPFAQGHLREYLNVHPDLDPQSLVASGMKYLHTRTSAKGWIIVHGDLHMTNILIKDGSTAVVSDFGLCTIISSEDPAVAHCEHDHRAEDEIGAPEGHYTSLAPEVAMKDQPRTVKSDVYSFGMVMFEAYARGRPFPESKFYSALVRLSAGWRPSRPEMKNRVGGLNDVLWDLITGCWAQEPSDRPTMAEVHARL